MSCTPHAKDGSGRDALRRVLGGVLLAMLAIWLIAVSSQAGQSASGAGQPESSWAEPLDADASAEPAPADLDKDVDTATRDFGTLALPLLSLAADAPAPRARDPNRPLRPPIPV